MNTLKIKENIKRIRSIKGYSQEYTAYKLGITQSAYSKIENNPSKLTLEQLYVLSDIFETSPNYILET